MTIKLWEMRISKHLTLIELEKLTKISKSKLNAIENEKVSPNLKTLEQIAEATGCTINDLFESDFK